MGDGDNVIEVTPRDQWGLYGDTVSCVIPVVRNRFIFGFFERMPILSKLLERLFLR